MGGKEGLREGGGRGERGRNEGGRRKGWRGGVNRYGIRSKKVNVVRPYVRP